MAISSSPQQPPDATVSPQGEGVAGTESTPRRTYPLPRVWAAVGLNWVVPGSGYFLVGERLRALALVVLLNGVFTLGLGLKGAVIVPEFTPGGASFNIINVLTFGMQLGAGGPALLSMAGHHLQGKGRDSGMVQYLGGEESAAVHDLGSFHLLLVGALNYFACCALYDRFRSRLGEGNRSDKGGGGLW